MNNATPAKSDLEVYKSVCWETGVRADDLEANKRLQLSTYQEQLRVRINPRAVLAVIGVCVLLIIPALFVRSTITYTVAIFAGIAILVLGYGLFASRGASDTDIVAVVEGTMSREMHKTGRSVYYRFRVADRTFLIGRPGYYALEHEIPVRAYYMLGTKTLVNLELLGDHPSGPPQRSNDALPYTDF